MKVNKKVLHVSTDNKFIEGAKNTFKDIFEENTFLILKPPFLSLKFVKNDNNTITKNYYSFIYNLKSKFYKKFDFIVLHDMNYFNSRLVLKHPELNYIYIHWGYEIHNNNYILSVFNQLRYKKTSLNSKYQFFQLVLNFLKYGILNTDFNNEKKIFLAINRINQIHLFNNEFEKFRDIGLLNKNCLLLPKFTYYPCSNKILNYKKKLNTVIVGNCAVRGINHLEIFKKISKLKFDKVIVPLSYGSTKYADEIITFGSAIFKDSFLPITEFLSILNYKKLFEEATFFIDDSVRQRAFGNILICLELGIKIYLNCNNPIYEFLISHQVSVFKTIDLQNNILIPLNEEEILKNKNFVKLNYSHVGVVNNWTSFFKRKTVFID